MPSLLRHSTLATAVFVLALGLFPPKATSEQVYTSLETVIYVDPSQATLKKFEKAIGETPEAKADGSLQCVIDYLKENANDPESIEYIQWSGIACCEWTANANLSMAPYWAARVKLRGANQFGGLSVTTKVFLIQNGAVVRVAEMDHADLARRLMAEEAFPPGSFPGEGPLRQSTLSAETQKLTESFDENFLGLATLDDQPKPDPKFATDAPPIPAGKIAYRQQGHSVTILNTPQGDVTMDVDMSGFAGTDAHRVGLNLNDPATYSNPMVVIDFANGKITRVKFDGREIFKEGQLPPNKTKEKRILRTFVDITGKHKTEAEFVRRDAQYVYLRTKANKTQKVPISRLSDIDRKWLDTTYPLDPRVVANERTASALLDIASALITPMKEFKYDQDETTAQREEKAEKIRSKVIQSVDRIQQRQFTLPFEITDLAPDGGNTRISIRQPDVFAKAYFGQASRFEHYFGTTPRGRMALDPQGTGFTLEQIEWPTNEAVLRTTRKGDYVAITGKPVFWQDRTRPDVIPLMRLQCLSDDPVAAFDKFGEVSIWFHVASVRVIDMEAVRQRFGKPSVLAHQADGGFEGDGTVRVEAGGMDLILENAPSFIGTPVTEPQRTK